MFSIQRGQVSPSISKKSPLKSADYSLGGGAMGVQVLHLHSHGRGACMHLRGPWTMGMAGWPCLCHLRSNGLVACIHASPASPVLLALCGMASLSLAIICSCALQNIRDISFFHIYLTTLWEPR
jgi:hypothetical protein